MSIEQRVKEIVAMQFAIDPEQLEVDAPMFSQYGMDDLDQVEITMGVEDEFGLYIEDEKMTAFRTTRDIIKYVQENAK